MCSLIKYNAKNTEKDLRRLSIYMLFAIISLLNSNSRRCSLFLSIDSYYFIRSRLSHREVSIIIHPEIEVIVNISMCTCRSVDRSLHQFVEYQLLHWFR